MYRRLEALLDRWTEYSLRHTRLVLIVAFVFSLVCVGLASRLELRSDFVEMLPTDSPSVVNLERLKSRVSSYATLAVAIGSPDLESSKKFAEDLVARLKTFPPERIKYVDYNLKPLRDYFDNNKYLYAELTDLSDFRDRLDRRIREETQENAFESLDDSPRPAKTDLRIAEMKAKYEAKSKGQDRYPGGYYVTPDKSLLVVFVRPPSGAGGFEANTRLVADVQAEVDRLQPARYHPEMTVGMTGDIKTGLEERDALAQDAEFIGILCLVLICGVIALYYRGLRSVLLIGTPMIIGLAAAMAVAWLSVGYLNTATAFLSSIIAGNGINFMIMLAARFFEEIHKRGPEHLDESLKVSVRGTVSGTLVASAAAAIAYGSLMMAGFRGFRQFGLIGGAGMVLCWLATFGVGPALVAWLHRMRPLAMRKESQNHPIASRVGWLVTRHPRYILTFSLVLTAASILVTIPYAFDPFEYDFHNLRNREGAKRGSAMLSNRVDKIFSLPQSPTPIVIDRAEDGPRVKEAILGQPSARAIVGDVKTLQDFLPKDQEKKLVVLGDIRRLIDSRIDFLPADQRKDLEDYRPSDNLRVQGLEDIPETVARTFTESDGRRGRILYVYSHPKSSLLDGKYLLKFARFVRGVKVDGVEMIASGQAMVFADMIDSILKDGVRVTVIAMVGVLVLLIVAFRSLTAIGTILAGVAMGTIWMIGFAALFDLKLNFLNFVVVPITLGISVDYGANLFARYRLEGAGRVAQVIQSTGGAVVLSSATTILGYAALITSTSMALQSFGIIADIGEFTCLFTAELTMMALIVWLENARKARQAKAARG
jgi:predicted RND superfamily exporter protein